MPSDKEKDGTRMNDGDVHAHPIPAEEIQHYSVTRDPDREQDIAHYVETQAGDEVVQHVEKIRTDYVMGEPFEVWEVITDKNDPKARMHPIPTLLTRSSGGKSKPRTGTIAPWKPWTSKPLACSYGSV